MIPWSPAPWSSSSSTAALISSDCGVSSFCIVKLSKSKSGKLVFIVFLSASFTILTIASSVMLAISLISPPTTTNPPFSVPVKKVSTATLDFLLFSKAFVKT